MRDSETTRALLLYLAAAALSWAAIGVVAALQMYVGFLPILFIPVVVVLHAYAGLGPAILGAGICTLGSLLLMGRAPDVPETLHSLTNLLIFAAVAGFAIYFLEALRRRKLLDRERVAEISILLESMPEAVLIFSPAGQVVDINTAAQEFAGMRRRQLIGMHLHELASRLTVLRSDEQPVAFPDLAVTKALHGETVRNERRRFFVEGKDAPMDAIVSASPLRGDGQVVGALVVIRDVTEVSQLQRRIADTERHLAVGQMAAGIAHDFNNVLDTIAQATAVLEMRADQPAEDRRVVLKMVDNAVRRGAEIIRRLREYIRGGTGEQSAVDVRQMMDEALELTKPLWQRDRRIAVITEFKPVPPVLANPADLRRVFANLIINAIQAMPEGGRLTLQVDQNNSSVAARVADTGVGIPPEQQKNIFLPYYTTKTTGTGLGLSVAQKIVLSQRGNIRFQSEPGKGTAFTVELPVMAEALREAPPSTKVA